MSKRGGNGHGNGTRGGPPTELVPRSTEGIVPPHDLNAEVSVLSCVLYDPSVIVNVLWLEPEHFFSEAHRRIWEAILYVRAAGQPIDTTTVLTRLKDSATLSLVGGAAGVVQLLGDFPARINIEAWARIVLLKWKRRQLIAAAQLIEARARLDESDTEVVVFAEAEQHITAITRANAGNLPRISAEEIFAPLPVDIPWLSKELRLISGRVAVVAGYAYSGKTLIVQQLALAVASSRPIWGSFKVDRPGLIVHANWDQPLLDTRYRYHRLARGMGLTPDDLRGRIELVQYPQISLDNPGGFAEVRAMCRGASLLVIDALIGAAGEIDDKDTKIGRVLYQLGSISEETGCAIIVIHHAVKAQQGTSGRRVEKRDPLQELRGSGAIAGAAGSVFVLEPKKNKPVMVHHARTPTLSGQGLEPFALRFEDLKPEDVRLLPFVAGANFGAVKVHYIDPNELAERQEQDAKALGQGRQSKSDKAIQREKEKAEAALAARKERERIILEEMKKQPLSSGNKLHDLVGGRRAAVFELLDDLSKRNLAAKDENGGWRAL